MATYQSISTNVDNNPSSPGTFTITKPTGLAVGDRMYAAIFAESGSGGAGTATVSTPSGWALEAQEQRNSDNANLYVFSKTADSADVAASNFGFAYTVAGTGSIGGHLMRVSSWGLEAGQVDEYESGITSSDTVTGFTPSRANCLFMAFVAQDNTVAHNSISSVALTTDNPTWTSRATTQIRDTGGSYYADLATYTATRTQDTATGTITVTYGASDTKNSFVIIIALAPQVDGSVTPTTKINGYALTPVQTIEVEALTELPTTTSRNVTSWTDASKGSTTWTGASKPSTTWTDASKGSTTWTNENK